MSLRVLHVIPSLSPYDGGPTKAVLGLARALRAEGASCLVVSTNADRSGELPVPCGRVVEHMGVECLFFPVTLRGEFKASFQLARWLCEHVADFDLLHIHALFSFSSVAAGYLAWARGVPYVLRPLGSLQEWAWAQRSRWKSLAWGAIFAPVVARASAVHFSSKLEERSTERAIGECANAIVVPLVAEFDLGSSALEPANQTGTDGSQYVLFLGRLAPVKGVELLIDAFATSAAALGPTAWRLVIAGDGPPDYVSSLRDRVAHHDLPASKISFTGWVLGEERRQLLASAGLAVLPSYQENFGLAALEALSVGVPVLVSENVGLAEYVVDAGAGWVSPSEVGALRRRLDEALGSAEQRTRCAAAAVELSRRFEPDRIARELLRAYCAFVPARAGTSLRA